MDDEEDIAYITDSGISIFPNEAPKPGLIVVRVGDDIITRHLDSHETLMVGHFFLKITFIFSQEMICG